MTTLVLNQIPRYPAHVSATNGLTAIVDNGVDVIISPSFGELVPVPSVTNPSATYFMAWDKDIDYYQSISFQDFAANLADNVLQGSLLAIKNVTFAANQGVYFSDANTANAYNLSAFVRGISGSADALAFRTAIGIGNVENTSDANKPISSAQQTALNLKADLASPTFTGDPKAPTPTAGDNDTSIATTAFVNAAISSKANLASPTFTGDPKAPTPATTDNDTSIATTAFVQAAILAAGKPVYGTLITASTAAININSGIPADAKRITLVSELSTATAMQPLIQLGSGGVLDTAGYVGGVQGNLSGAGNAPLSTSFLLTNSASSAGPYYGTITLTRQDPSQNKWVINSSLSWSSSGGGAATEGTKTLGGILDRIQIGSVAGTVAFSGTLGIIVERF